MSKLIIFGVLSLLATAASWRSLSNVRSHGFYRFFSWLCLSWLFASNYKYWFVNPFSLKQVISWILLTYSAYLAIAGLCIMKTKGFADSRRDDNTLFGFEKTTELIETGVFKYIRHPLYSSLIFITWGIFLKNPTYLLFGIAVVSTVFLYFTSRFDEKECLSYFGEKYASYMKRTHMFLPYIF